MKILGFNLRISRGESREMAAPQQRGVGVTLDQWMRGEDLGGLSLSNPYQQVVWVYRAINVLAEQVANVPFRFAFGETGSEQLVTSGPVADFYARPHPQISGFEYWELRVMWLLLRGECMRVPVYDEAARAGRRERRLARVLLLDPAHFQHVVADDRLVGWRYTGFGPQAPLPTQVFLPEEVWFEKLPNPFDFWRGMSPLQTARLAAETDFAASAFMKGIIENNGDCGLIVRSEKPLADEQKLQLLAALRERKRRAGIADRPLVIENSAEIVKPGLSSSDLQFLENRKFSRGEICAAFGVPEEIVSATDHAKYDIMEGARRNFIENRVVPLCARLEAEENATTLPALAGSLPRPAGSAPLRGWFDTDSLPILQQARRDRLAAAKTGFDMGIPFNELNRVLDLGFKHLPWGDTGFLPAKYQRVGAESPGVPVPLTFIGGPECSASGSVKALLAAGPEAQGSATDAMERARRFLDGLQCEKPSPEFLAVQAEEQALADKLSRFLFEQRARALAGLARGEVKVESLLNLEEEDAALRALLGPLAQAAQEKRCESLNKLIAAALERSLAEALAAKESSLQLAARVRRVYNTFSRNPATHLEPQRTEHPQRT